MRQLSCQFSLSFSLTFGLIIFHYVTERLSVLCSSVAKRERKRKHIVLQLPSHVAANFRENWTNSIAWIIGRQLLAAKWASQFSSRLIFKKICYSNLNCFSANLSHLLYWEIKTHVMPEFPKVKLDLYKIFSAMQTFTKSL